MAVEPIAAAIERMEGFYPGSLAWRNNNPGNLVFVGQPGARAGAGGFAAFDSVELGRQALKNQIQLDIDRGRDAAGRPVVTLADLIASWAPPSENDTAQYIRNVAAWTGISPDAVLSAAELPVYSVDVFLPPDSSGAAGGAPGGSSESPAAGEDWKSAGENFLSAGLDLSAVGGSGVVPWAWIAAGVVGLVAIRRLL